MSMLTARVPARRSTRFWSYVDHDRKDHDEAHRETQGSRPAPVSHLHHPLSQGSGQPPQYNSVLETIVPYHAQKSSPPDREGLMRLQADRAVGALRAREQGRALG